MFDLNKEIEEVKLDYYIMKQAPNGVIELALSDIVEILGVSKSKAQRLIEKFIRLGILTIEKKSTSRNTKTVYRYMQNTDIDINVDTNKCIYTNVCIDNDNTKIDTNNDTIVSIYENYVSKTDKFKYNDFMRESLSKYQDRIDVELFEYLLDQIANRTGVISKEKYLLTTLNNIMRDNVRNIEDYYESTEKHKKEVKKQEHIKKWGFGPGPEYEMDWEELAKKSANRQ